MKKVLGKYWWLICGVAFVASVGIIDNYTLSLMALPLWGIGMIIWLRSRRSKRAIKKAEQK